MKLPQPSGFQQHSNRGISAILLSIFTNTILAVVKIVTGIFGNSYALIADGIESTVDIFSSTIVWGGLKVAARPPDGNHPFGHGKAESLAGMVVSLLLLGAAIAIAGQSIREILTPHHSPEPYTLLVLIGVIFTKEIMARFILKTGQSINSLSLQVDAWHHRSDALTSAAALVGISVSLLAGKGYESALLSANLGILDAVIHIEPAIQQESGE